MKEKVPSLNKDNICWKSHDTLRFFVLTFVLLEVYGQSSHRRRLFCVQKCKKLYREKKKKIKNILESNPKNTWNDGPIII